MQVPKGQVGIYTRNVLFHMPYKCLMQITAPDFNYMLQKFFVFNPTCGIIGGGVLI